MGEYKLQCAQWQTSFAYNRETLRGSWIPPSSLPATFGTTVTVLNILISWGSSGRAKLNVEMSWIRAAYI